MARCETSEQRLTECREIRDPTNPQNSLITKKKTLHKEVSHMGSERIELPTFWV